jgi:glycosyltransferase involved in cell wall biosynthesis
VRVVFLTHYFVPEAGAAQVRIAALARGLQQRGVHVTVHTGFPHYPAGRITPPYRNHLARREDLDGLPVVRSFTYAVPNAGFVRRVANHAVLAVSTLATARASGPADVVVAETPPLFMAASGVLHAAGKRAALAINVSDRWPESAVQLGALTQPQAVAVAEALERWCYRHADAITAPTQGIVDAVAALPDGAGKVHHVPPAVDLARWASVADAAPRDGAPLRVLYAGTLGMAQRVETLVEAARIAGPDVVQLTIAGDGPDRPALEDHGQSNVHVRDSVPAADVARLYADADVGSVTLRDVPIFAGALPTKLFEVLAAGRPCVLSAPAGEASRVIDTAGCGVTVAPEDPQALADAWRSLHADHAAVVTMGQRARRAAAAYDRERVIDQWHALLTQLAAGRRSSRAAAGRRPSG